MKTLEVTELEYRILFARAAIRKTQLGRWLTESESCNWSSIILDLGYMLRPHVLILSCGRPQLTIKG